jgi:hypothetical protein
VVVVTWIIRTSLMVAARMASILSDRTASRPSFCFFGMRRMAGDLLVGQSGAGRVNKPILGITKTRSPISARILSAAEAYSGGKSLIHFDGTNDQATMICQSWKKKWNACVAYQRPDDIETLVQIGEGAKILLYKQPLPRLLAC